MIKKNEPEITFIEGKTDVDDARSFHDNYRLAKQNYNEILENLEPIIRYGNMSVEEIERFVHHYENPYVVRCKKYANQEQSKQIEQLQKEMDQRLSILLIMCHDGLKQAFMKKLAIYGYTQKGKLFHHFIHLAQTASFQYIIETSKDMRMEAYEVDQQGNVTLARKHLVQKINIEPTGRFHLYQRTSLFHTIHRYYHIKDIDMTLLGDYIILRSFDLEEEQKGTIIPFSNRILLKNVTEGKGKQFTAVPYVYKEMDDVSRLVQECITQWM